MIQNPEQFRENVVNAFKEKINNDELAGKAEELVYNQSVKYAEKENVVPNWSNIYFTAIYKIKLKSLMSNLQKWVLNPETSNHYEWEPEYWEPYFEENRKKEARNNTESVIATTDTFTCSKCKSNKCTYTQAQTRSADEGITTFITCLVCDKKWKIN